MKKSSLDTPSLVLDLDVFESNLIKMRDRALACGKKLRPHAKTHKCSEMAKRQLAAGNCAGICAAKVSEAAALADAGITDILLTSPVASAMKIEALMTCAKKAPGLLVAVDDCENAAELDAAAKNAGLKLGVLVDVNPDMGRTGISYEKAFDLACRMAAMPNLRFAGLQCYAGQLQHVKSFDERHESSLEKMKRAAEIVRRLRSEGPGCGIFTGTGTGTSDIDSEIPELTDIQVGSYCVMDAEYTFIGSKGAETNAFFKPALTLLASVVSRNQNDFVTIDAGLKSMYFTPHAPPRVMIDGKISPDYRYEWFGDEHGRLYFNGAKPQLGARFELCLPHCDPSINMHDAIYAARGDEIVDVWKIDLRGCSR